MSEKWSGNPDLTKRTIAILNALDDKPRHPAIVEAAALRAELAEANEKIRILDRELDVTISVVHDHAPDLLALICKAVA